MNKGHLTEEEIQQYAIDKAETKLEIVRHLSTCEICKEKVNTYQLLFSEVRKIPSPVFEFNISDLILPQLTLQKPRFSWDDFLIYTLISIGIFLAGTVFYMLRGLFFALSTMGLYLVVATSCTILIFMLLGLYKKHQEQIKLFQSY